MTHNAPLPRAPLPTTPPSWHLLHKRTPCDDCTTLIESTWIPVNLTTTSCDTTSTNVWWTPDLSSTTPTPTVTTDIMTQTATVTVTSTVTSAAQAVEQMTCCQRHGRWPNVQTPWHSRDFDPINATLPDSYARQKRWLSFDGEMERSLNLRFDRRDNLLEPRWADDPVTSVVTVTDVQTYTSTSTIWTPAAPTSPPSSDSGYGSSTPQNACEAQHWCNSTGDGPASKLDQICGCIVAWVTVIYGGVPGRANDLAASLVFFFTFLLFFLVGLSRMHGCRKNLAIVVILLPISIFGAGMVGYFGIRAWTANNEADARHILALHTMLMVVPLFLIDAAYQLFGLLAKRAKQGCWILYTSWVVRCVNLVMLILYIVAACDFTSFLDSWVATGDNCDSVSSQNLSLLPLVADFFVISSLILLMILTVMVRLKHCLPIAVLVHVLVIFKLLTLHMLWRILRDLNAAVVWYEGWEHWTPPSSATGVKGAFDAASTCWGVEEDGTANWLKLSKVRDGTEMPAAFYLLGILTLLLALFLLYMVNVPVYLSATPAPEPPRPDPNARYKMTFNAETQRMELAKVDQAELTGPLDENGKPYYRLVRSNAGKWKFKGAEETKKSNAATNKMKQLVFGWQC